MYNRYFIAVYSGVIKLNVKPTFETTLESKSNFSIDLQNLNEVTRKMCESVKNSCCRFFSK